MPRKKNDLSQRLENVIKTLVPQQEQNPGPYRHAKKRSALADAPLL